MEKYVRVWFSLFYKVSGNYIGTNVTGTAGLGNAGYGVRISNGSQFNLVGTNGDGTADLVERNVISGNQSDGVFIGGVSSDSKWLLRALPVLPRDRR